MWRNCILALWLASLFVTVRGLSDRDLHQKIEELKDSIHEWPNKDLSIFPNGRMKKYLNTAKLIADETEFWEGVEVLEKKIREETSVNFYNYFRKHIRDGLADIYASAYLLMEYPRYEVFIHAATDDVNIVKPGFFARLRNFFFGYFRKPTPGAEYENRIKAAMKGIAMWKPPTNIPDIFNVIKNVLNNVYGRSECLYCPAIMTVVGHKMTVKIREAVANEWAKIPIWYKTMIKVSKADSRSRKHLDGLRKQLRNPSPGVNKDHAEKILMLVYTDIDRQVDVTLGKLFNTLAPLADKNVMYKRKAYSTENSYYWHQLTFFGMAMYQTGSLGVKAQKTIMTFDKDLISRIPSSSDDKKLKDVPSFLNFQQSWNADVKENKDVGFADTFKERQQKSYMAGLDNIQERRAVPEPESLATPPNYDDDPVPGQANKLYQMVPDYRVLRNKGFHMTLNMEDADI